VLFLVPVLVAALSLAWLGWRKSQTPPYRVSGFVEAHQVRVGSRVGGRVAEVVTAEGLRVSTGDLLLRMDPFDLKEKLAHARSVAQAHRAEQERLQAGFRPEEIEQARARRDQAAATLEKLIAGPRPREIEIARQHLEMARAGLELAMSEHERLSLLRTDDQAAKLELDRAIRALKQSRAEVSSAEQELALLEEGTRKEEIAAARALHAEMRESVRLMESGYRKEDIAQATARVAAAEADVAAIETQIRELSVFSPCDCTVEAVDLRPGDLVAPNAPVISLLDESSLWLRAYVPESRLGSIRLGDPVDISWSPGRRNQGVAFSGHVAFISREAEFTPRNIQTPEERSKQVFRIKVSLDARDIHGIRPGMIVDVLLPEMESP